MNRAGDAEFLLQDMVAPPIPAQKYSFKRGFIFGLGMILGLWFGGLIAGGLTIIVMILTGVALQ